MTEAPLMPDRAKAIVRAAAAEFGIEPAVLLGRTKPKALKRQRWETWRRLRQLQPRPSLPKIGRWFGGRDHTTVLFGLRRLDEGS